MRTPEGLGGGWEEEEVQEGTPELPLPAEDAVSALAASMARHVV